MKYRVLSWLKTQILVFFLVSFSTAVLGVEVKNLYIVDLLLDTTIRGPADQAKLLDRAFRKVLVQVSGSEKVLTHPMMEPILKEPDKYVKQFSYHQPSATERMMKVVFNETRVNELLHNAGQRIWGKNRPLTLVWIIIDRDKKLQWANKDSEPQLLLDMENVLNKRGSPVVFPLFDLTDTGQVSEQEVLNGAFEPLQQGAKRYSADVVLLGRLNEQSNGWSAHWTLLNSEGKGSKTTWNNKAIELNTLLSETAEHLIARLQQYKKGEIEAPISHSFLSVVVSGIASAEQYAEVLEHLKKLPYVKTVEVTQTTPVQTIFTVHTEAQKEVIAEAIHQGKVLVENPPAAFESEPEVENEQTLHYKLTGA